MKFSALKALPVPGKITPDWKTQVNQSFVKDPVVVKKDYEKLVRAIADLELMEEYLRKEVLHDDASTSTLRQTVDLARELGYFVAPILAAFSPGAASKVGSIIATLDNLRGSEESRRLLRSF